MINITPTLYFIIAPFGQETVDKSGYKVSIASNRYSKCVYKL